MTRGKRSQRKTQPEVAEHATATQSTAQPEPNPNAQGQASASDAKKAVSQAAKASKMCGAPAEPRIPAEVLKNGKGPTEPQTGDRLRRRSSHRTVLPRTR